MLRSKFDDRYSGKDWYTKRVFDLVNDVVDIEHSLMKHIGKLVKGCIIKADYIEPQPATRFATDVFIVNIKGFLHNRMKEINDLANTYQNEFAKEKDSNKYIDQLRDVF